MVTISKTSDKDIDKSTLTLLLKKGGDGSVVFVAGVQRSETPGIQYSFSNSSNIMTSLSGKVFNTYFITCRIGFS
ncbi:MAG: hypothetical protein AAGG80_03115 [Pseudomonadota bacterium]